MDPAHTRSSPSRLKLIEGDQQQHEACFPAAATEAGQMVVNQEQALNAIAAQIQRLTNAITLQTPPVVHYLQRLRPRGQFLNPGTLRCGS